MIPNAGYWTYVIVKCQYWSFLGIIAFVEMEDLCLPQSSNISYVSSFIVGFCTPPVVHTIAYFMDLQNNFYLYSFAVTSAVVPVIIIYGLDSFYHEVEGELTSNVCPGNQHSASVLSASKGKVKLFAAFSAALLFERQQEVTIHEGNKDGSTVSDSRQACLSTMGKENSDQTRITVVGGARTIPRHEDRTTTVISDNEGFMTQFAGWAVKYTPRALRSEVVRNENNNPNTDGISAIQIVDIETASYNRRIRQQQRLMQWGKASLYNLFFNNYYYFLIWFTNYFQSSVQTAQSRVLLFAMFVAVGTVMRGFLKLLGLSIDRHKKHSVSYYFLAEVMCLLFYYTFYRVLFESVTSWELFSAFQVIHLSSEWVLYPLRATSWYFNSMQYVSTRAETSSMWGCLSAVLTTGGLSHRDWQCFIALDFGLRCVVFVVSSIGISTMLVTVAFFPHIDNSLSQTTPALLLTLAFIGLATLLELINAYCMNELYFRRHGLPVQQITAHSLSNRPFLFVSAVLAAVLLINPMAAFETSDHF